MKHVSKFLQGILPISLAVLLIAVVIAIQLPIEIYINNTEEFTIPIKSLTVTLASAFGAIFLLFFLPALIPNITFRQYYFSFLATLGILMWFTAHFTFGSYGAFDGRGLNIDIFSLRAIGETILWIALLVGSLLFSRKICKLQLQIVSGLLVIVAALTSYQLIQFNANKDTSSAIGTTQTSEYVNEEFLTFSTRSNIVHILLDEQQSTIIEKLIETNPVFAKSLDGFTFFPNTAANYPSTIMAVPAVLSGRVYKNESDRTIFTNEVLNKNPFLTVLENNNYTTQLYTVGTYCGEDKLKNCTPLPGLSGTNSAYLLLDYSLFRAVPDMLKPRIYRDEDWLLARKFINPNHQATAGGLAHLSFEYFNQHWQVKDVAPTYKFYHSMLTHSPMVLDAECNLLTQRVSRHSLEGRLDQSSCAFKHVFTFLQKLKQENIYDNSLIIISSDHGGRYAVPEQQQNLAERDIKYQPHSAALATLLIKPINSHGPLKISTAPAALSDIPNTILSLLELPLIEDGENIFSLSADQERKREFIFYDLEPKYWVDHKLAPLTIFTINGDVRDANSWSYQCSDESNLGYNKCSP